MPGHYDITRDELYELYVDRGYSIGNCADYSDCSTTLVEFKLSEFAIPTRPPGSTPIEVSRERLHELSVDGLLTTTEIAARLDCHPSTVSSKLREYGISTTGPNHGRSIQISEDQLRRLYLDEEQTTYEIADRFDCDPTVIERRLRWFGIETRYTSAGDGDGEVKYGSNWAMQRRRALEAAGYRCERCGITDDEHRELYVDTTREVGFGLDVHHRVSAKLFDRWDAASPEDANSLSNLEVLCQDCHVLYGDRIGTARSDSG